MSSVALGMYRFTTMTELVRIAEKSREDLRLEKKHWSGKIISE